MTDLFTPAVSTGDLELADPNSRLAYWKQILPLKQIHYTGQDGKRHTVNFDEKYLSDLAEMKGIDKIGFLLADANNKHNMDPERWRGDVVKMEVRKEGEHPGLYGKIVFPTKEAASAVLNNPDLGVSARIREGIHQSDGSTVGRGIIHVLGTLDPQVRGMKAWETADLSVSEVDALDLSTEEYEDADMAKKPEVKPDDQKKALEDYTSADIDAMTEAELDSFLAEHAPEFDATIVNSDENEEENESEDNEDEGSDENESDTNSDEDESQKQLVGAGADMSKEMQNSIDLANSRASYAEGQVREMRAELNAEKWSKERGEYLAAGVPAHILDLAAPVLSHGGDFVIDLSNGEGEADELNVAPIVRGMLDSMKGYIDLSAEEGHSGTASLSDTEQYDAEVGALWNF